MGSKFKIGDTVRIVKDLGGNNLWTIGRVGVITSTNDSFGDSAFPFTVEVLDEGKKRCISVSPKEIEFANKISFMGKITSIARTLLDSDLRKMVSAKILNSDLTLTEEGREMVLAQYIIENKEKFGKLADEMLKEKKSNKDCKEEE